LKPPECDGSGGAADGATAKPPGTVRLVEIGRSHIRQKGDGAGPLDGHSQLALVLGAGAGYASRNDLAALGGEIPKQLGFLLFDAQGLVSAEAADLAAVVDAALAFPGLGSIGGHVMLPP
jgi:hypothetical protein